MVAEVASGAGTDALRYFIADKYVKAFEVLAGNTAQKLVIVPMESSALAGGIAQAMELLRGPDGQSRRRAAAPRPPRPRRRCPRHGPRADLDPRRAGCCSARRLMLPGVFLLWVGLAAIGTGLMLFAAARASAARPWLFLVLLAAGIALALRLRAVAAPAPAGEHARCRAGRPHGVLTDRGRAGPARAGRATATGPARLPRDMADSPGGHAACGWKAWTARRWWCGRNRGRRPGRAIRAGTGARGPAPHAGAGARGPATRAGAGRRRRLRQIKDGSLERRQTSRPRAIRREASMPTRRQAWIVAPASAGLPHGTMAR